MFVFFGQYYQQNSILQSTQSLRFNSISVTRQVSCILEDVRDEKKFKTTTLNVYLKKKKKKLPCKPIGHYNWLK